MGPRSALPDGRHAYRLALGRPIRDKERRIKKRVGLNLYIPDRKRKEERLEVISVELDHRVKNVLDMVSAIARATSGQLGVKAGRDLSRTGPTCRVRLPGKAFA